jgi:hypothetical protein
MRRPPGPGDAPRNRDTTVIWTISLILMGLWIWAMTVDYTLGGFIHILLIASVLAGILQSLLTQAAGNSS